jgi:hypothetical protein
MSLWRELFPLYVEGPTNAGRHGLDSRIMICGKTPALGDSVV